MARLSWALVVILAVIGNEVVNCDSYSRLTRVRRQQNEEELEDRYGEWDRRNGGRQNQWGGGRFPNQGGRFPSQSGQFEGQNGQFPGQGGHFPGQNGQFPGQNGQFPGQNGQFPGQNGQFPGQNGQFPGQNGQFPGQNGQFPGQNGQFPGQGTQPAQPNQAQTVSTTVPTTVTMCMRSCLATAEYNPVCGSNGVTYDNPGLLTCAQSCGLGVSQARFGRCPAATAAPTPAAPTQGTSSTDIKECIWKCPTTSEYNPVCGTDGVTYYNSGKLNCAAYCSVGVKFSHYGDCSNKTNESNSATNFTQNEIDVSEFERWGDDEDSEEILVFQS